MASGAKVNSGRGEVARSPTRRLARLVSGFVLGVAAFAVHACSDIEQRTYLLQSSADAQPHTVELWYEKSEPREWTRAYSVRFPQYYYAYDDNHKSAKQTTVGLLLDRKSLEPLAVSIARERGVADLSKATASERAAIVKAMKTKHWDRAMLVTVSNVAPMVKPGPDETYHRLFKPVGERAGFTLFSRRDPPPKAEDPPELDGYSASKPFVWVRCPGGNRNCSFSVGYKRSSVKFVLPRSEFERAVPIAKHLVHLLELHDVSAGANQ